MKALVHRRSIRIAIALALFAVLTASGWGAGRVSIHAHAAPAHSPARCALACRAAYDVLAAVLPRDRDNVLADAILRTPHFDYAELTRSLHVPTTTEIEVQWRHHCHLRYPDDTSAEELCFRAIRSWTPFAQDSPLAA